MQASATTHKQVHKQQTKLSEHDLALHHWLAFAPVLVHLMLFLLRLANEA
jgi:hypothetical protein